jgi:hypothetical protein
MGLTRRDWMARKLRSDSEQPETASFVTVSDVSTDGHVSDEYISALKELGASLEVIEAAQHAKQQTEQPVTA